MNATSPNPQANPALLESAPPLDVLVVYEDAEARTWAHGVCARVVTELSAEFEFGCSWYELASLKNSEVARHATSAALGADVIIFSAKAAAEPSSILKTWVESWVPARTPQKSALMAIISDTGKCRNGGASLKTFLHGIAQRAGMDFLTQSVPAKTVTARTATAVQESSEEHLELGEPVLA